MKSAADSLGMQNVGPQGQAILLIKLWHESHHQSAWNVHRVEAGDIFKHLHCNGTNSDWEFRSMCWGSVRYINLADTIHKT